MNRMHRISSFGDRSGARGRVRLTFRDAQTGLILDRVVADNLIVKVGRTLQLELLNGGALTPITHVAVGTGSTAPVAGNTTLETELSRIAIASFDESGYSQEPPWWMAEAQFSTSQANGTLTEIGLFTASVGGTMYGRATFADKVKTSSQTLDIQYQVFHAAG